jgi:membrane protein required for colicin V production
MVPAFALTTLDWVVLGLIAVFALRGAFKGFVWQAVRLVALFGAVWGAGAWHGWLGGRLGSWFTFLPGQAVPLVAWIAIFIALMILGSYLAYMVRGLIRSADLSALDRTAGLVLGAATGLALCTLLLLLGGAILARTDNRGTFESAIRGSESPVYLVKAAELLAPMLPEGVRDAWIDACKCVTPGT